MTDRSHNPLWRMLVALGWGAVIAAPFCSHAAIATGRFSGLAMVLAAVQFGVLAVMALRRRGPWRPCFIAAAVVGAILLVASRAGGFGQAGLIASSGVTHAAIYGGLLLLFGLSLRSGHVPLVTGLASRVRGVLTPEMRTYTRTVTKAWCFFCLAQLALSAVLLVVAPAWIWSLFVNVLDPLLVVSMFLAEYAVRRWRFRHDRHYSPLSAARAFARDRAGG